MTPYLRVDGCSAFPEGAWCGQVAVVVGTGPSLTLDQVYAIAHARSRNRCRVIAVNDAIFPLWCADIALAGDRLWWLNRDLRRFFGAKFGLAESFYDAAEIAPDMFMLRRSGLEGCELTPGIVATHGNSGAIAVQLAAQLLGWPKSEAGRLVVVGFDLAGEHFFGRYQAPLGQNEDSDKKDRWRAYFQAFVDTLGERLVSTTAIYGVRRVELSEVL